MSVAFTTCLGSHDTEPPDAETGHLCQRCYDRLRRNLTQLPSLAVWLEAHIAAGGSSALDDQRVTGSRDAPIPLRLDVLDLIGPHARDAVPREVFFDQAGDPSMLDTVGSWSKLVHEEHGIAWPDSNDLTTLTTYLAGQLMWIAHQPWIDEFAAEIASIVRRAARCAPWQPERRRVKDEVCDQCGMRALVTHVAEGQTVCEKRMGGCGARRQVTEYMQRARGREAS